MSGFDAQLGLASLGLIVMGFVVGWPIGAWTNRPVLATWLIGFLTAALAVAASVFLALNVSGDRIGSADNTMGIATLIAGIVGFSALLVAAAAWIGINLGLWLGAWAGWVYRRKRATRSAGSSTA